MARTDLLVLTDADLADISNRGNVNRARKELDQNKVTWKLDEAGDTITVVWSDGPTTVLPAGRVLADAECSCAASGMCRHIVRAVLVYQAAHAGEAEAQISEASTTPWNPGDVTDEQLAALFPARKLQAFREVFDEGLVVELVRSAKPLARFHRLRHTIRFLVPGDVRYTQCDCSEPAPCTHAVLAVWAFRLMGEDAADLVTTASTEAPVDGELLDEVEATLASAIRTGFANIPTVTMDRWRALEQRLRDGGLVWPTEILGELRRQYDYYQAHDSRFGPDILAGLVGELLIRFDALRKDDLPIPRLFIRGDQRDAEARLGQTRLVGLGCGVLLRHRSVVIQALLQDDSTGTVVGVSRAFADPEGEEEDPESFTALASRLVVKGRDLGTIGAGQLVIKSATLYGDHRLSLGRSTSTVYAQRYLWEDLRPPVSAESFEEVRARLGKLPPASLRPRRLGEDFHVVRVAAVEWARFSEREQEVRALLVDAGGHRAELRHPYMSRNRAGTERLLNWLTGQPEKLIFVGGTFRLAASGLVVAPTGLVFSTGEVRTFVQPWIDDMDAHLEVSTVSIDPPATSQAPLDRLRERLATEIGDLVLVGTDEAAASGQAQAEWDALERLSGGLALSSIGRAIERFSNASAGEPRVRAVHDLAVLSRLSQELG